MTIQKLLLYDILFKSLKKIDTLLAPLITDRKLVKNSMVDMDIFNTLLATLKRGTIIVFTRNKVGATW